MKIVGLTGGIGSGKSTVSRILRELGAYVIEADELAREVVFPGEPAWREIKEVFGEGVLERDNRLNRKKLAEIVFADAEKRRKLEQITHPRIGERMMQELEKARKCGAKIAVIDAALLLESGLKDWVKPVILVMADERVRVERVCKRDKVCEDEVLARIRSQSPDSEKIKCADFVIENNGGLEELRERVAEVFQKIIQR